MDEKRPDLALSYFRRFGVEIEINAFDGLPRPLKAELPDGIYYVGNLVHKTTGEKVLIHKWGHDHNNDCWIIKPDGSCGMEACSPVSKGWYGLRNICEVIEAFAADPKITSDERCSLHIHVDVSDLSGEQLLSVLSWWVKCEAVFLDSVPPSRKRNRYCQFLGLCEMFEHDSVYTLDQLVRRLGHAKYGTVNTFHLKAGKRQSIEFRIMENECCLDPYMTKNWVRLVVHFVEMMAKREPPKIYAEGDPWTGFCWLDPADVFRLLGFDGSADLSPGLSQVRSWFLGRLLKNTARSGLSGAMSDPARKVAYEQCKDLLLRQDINVTTPTDMAYALYGENFRV